MASDVNLIHGAAAAYKNRDAGKIKGLDKITSSINQWAQNKKKENDALKEKQDQASAALSKVAVEMAPHMKVLGQDAFNQYKSDVAGLREEMAQAIEDDDQDAIMDLNIRLNEMKSNAVKDKDGYEAIIQSHEENLLDFKAMTPEGQQAHENFLNNPTREFTKTEDGQSAYMWQVQDEDGNPIQKTAPSGTPLFDPVTQEPIYETQTYTLDELNDFSAMPDTENGTKYMDMITEKTEGFKTGTNYEIDDFRNEVSKIIPTDAKALRSWAYSNPTENSDLDVYGYLMDHPILNEGHYADLGVEDTNGDGFIKADDIISAEDREMFIEKIMSAENPKITHDILTDIYTSVGYKTVVKPDEVKDYSPNDQQLMGGNIDAEAETASVQQNKLKGIQEGLRLGESIEVLIKRLELTPDEVQNGLWDGKKRVTIDSIAPAAAIPDGSSKIKTSKYNKQ